MSGKGLSGDPQPCTLCTIMIWEGKRGEAKWWHVALVLETTDGRWWQGFVRIGLN